MPADVSGAVDMEKVKPGPNPTPYWIAMIEGVVRMLFPTAFARIEAGIGRFPANLPFPSSHDALN